MARYNLRDGLPSKYNVGDVFYLQNMYPDTTTAYDGSFDKEVKNIAFPKGIYRLHLWGAGSYRYTSTNGQRGAYVSGDLVLDATTAIWLRCGGVGGASQITSPSSDQRGHAGEITYYGGYNGGRNGRITVYSDLSSGYGPSCGATDIRIGADDLNHCVAMAGGAGGSSYNQYYGASSATFYQRYLEGYTNAKGWTGPCSEANAKTWQSEFVRDYLGDNQTTNLWWCSGAGYTDGNLLNNVFIGNRTTHDQATGTDGVTNYSVCAGPGGGGWLGGKRGTIRDGTGNSGFYHYIGSGGYSWCWCEDSTKLSFIPSGFALANKYQLTNYTVVPGDRVKILPNNKRGYRQISTSNTGNNAGWIEIEVLSKDTTLPEAETYQTSGGIYFHDNGKVNDWSLLQKKL